MSKIPINIALLPTRKDQRQALKTLSQLSLGILYSKYILGINSEAHVTVLQFDTVESNLDTIWESIKQEDIMKML